MRVLPYLRISDWATQVLNGKAAFKEVAHLFERVPQVKEEAFSSPPSTLEPHVDDILVHYIRLGGVAYGILYIERRRG